MRKPPVPKQAELKYSRDAYLPVWSRIMQQMTEQEARREYSRLRAIAVKRMQRLEESGLSKSSYQYQRRSMGFPTLKELAANGGLNTKQFAREFAALATFITAKTSTVTGVREQQRKARETFEARGIVLNDEQWARFGDFMAEYRAIYGRKHRGSEAAVDLFHTIEKAGIETSAILNDFYKWYENAGEVEQLLGSGKRMTADQARKALGW